MKKIEFKNKKMIVCVACFMLVMGVVGVVWFGKNRDSGEEFEVFDDGVSNVVEGGGNSVANGLRKNVENGSGSGAGNGLGNSSGDGSEMGSRTGSQTGSEKGEKNGNQEKNKEQEIYIHIIGEVKNQGIIVLKKGDRICDAIEKAGGITENADLSKVNLAYVLSDGQKLRIPNINDKNENISYISAESGDNNVVEGGNGSMKNGEKININNASQTELETITGIGPSIAAKIIQYREKNGKFKKVEDLRNVSGIGESKFEGMKDEVEV